MSSNDPNKDYDAAVTVAVMSPTEAARYLGLAVSTLAKMRCWGGGPEFLKLGRKVGYERSPCDEWKKQRRARNTSDAAARLPAKLTIAA